MSLYDEIYCDVPLPDREIPAEICFQTKSLPWPGNFSRYRITAAGVSLMSAVEISSRRDTLIFSETTTKPPMDLSSIERGSWMAS
jgi:hypothetical protein